MKCLKNLDCPSGYCREGECATTLNIGDPCKYNRCGQGRVCDTYTRRCRNQGLLSPEVLKRQRNRECWLDEECDPAFYCALGDQGGMKCRPRKFPGQECLMDSECRDGSGCGPDFKCEKKCFKNSDCGFGQICSDHYWVQGVQLCQPRPKETTPVVPRFHKREPTDQPPKPASLPKPAPPPKPVSLPKPAPPPPMLPPQLDSPKKEVKAQGKDSYIFPNIFGSGVSAPRLNVMTIGMIFLVILLLALIILGIAWAISKCQRRRSVASAAAAAAPAPPSEPSMHSPYAPSSSPMLTPPPFGAAAGAPQFMSPYYSPMADVASADSGNNPTAPPSYEEASDAASQSFDAGAKGSPHQK